MLKEGVPVVMVTLLALGTARVEVAAGQERTPAVPSRVLQQPRSLLAAGKPDLTCILFIARDQGGTQPIAEGVPLTWEAFFGDKPYDRRLATDAPRVWVHRTVKNEGNSGTGPFTGRASVDVSIQGQPPIHIPPLEETIGPLPPGGSHVSPPLPVELKPNTQSIAVGASYDEPDNAVDESNEGNNECAVVAHVQTPPPAKPESQVALQAAQPVPHAAAQVAPRGDQEESVPNMAGMAAVVQALIPPAPDVTCTAWASRNMNGSGVIPSGSSQWNAIPVDVDEIWLHVTVRNLGQAEAQNFNTRTQVYEWNAPKPYTDKSMTLESGLTYRYREKVNMCQGICNFGIHVLTDFPNFALSESNESNNECRAEVWVYNPTW